MNSKQTAELEFTELTPADYKDAIELWKESEGVDLTIGDKRQEIELYLNRNPGMSFKCKDRSNDKLAGTILCGHEGRRGFIYHLAVREEYRSLNIASTLLKLSLDTLRSEGIQRCMIMAKASNKDAMLFWEHAGWIKREDLCMYSLDLPSDKNQ